MCEDEDEDVCEGVDCRWDDFVCDFLVWSGCVGEV